MVSRSILSAVRIPISPHQQILTSIRLTYFLINVNEVYYKFNKCDAIWKYVNKLTASTNVVINGLAITAGSNPIFLASIGKVHPITFATIIAINSVEQTTIPTKTSTLSINISFKKFAITNVNPQSTATLTSFQITFKISENSISFKD